MTIAVLGANGQVGSEVCIALSEIGLPVIAIVRSPVGCALLRRAGVKCRVGSLSNPEAASGLLEGCDTVADFSLPGGMPSEIRAGARRVIEAALSAQPRRFVYMSTTMAFGMNPAEGRYCDKTVSRTPYAAWKRHAEKHAFALAREHHQVSVFRLGQVHGQLQQATHALLSALRQAPGRLRVLNHPTDIVLAATIAQALASVHEGHASGEVYTLVDSPDWPLAEFQQLIATEAGLGHVIESVSDDGRQELTLRAALVGKVAQFREPLLAHVMPHVPSAEWRAKARWSLARVRSELAELRPTVVGLRGPVPGPRYPNPPDPRASFELQRRIGARLRGALGEGGRLFGS